MKNIVYCSCKSNSADTSIVQPISVASEVMQVTKTWHYTYNDKFSQVIKVFNGWQGLVFEECYP